VQLPMKRNSSKRRHAVAWITSMQCHAGGWAAFDINNDQDWLNYSPYSDLKAMIDPNTADVTARVLEMVGRCNLSIDSKPEARSRLSQARAKTLAAGLVVGGNYIYGTSSVLTALSCCPQAHQLSIEQGAAWLRMPEFRWWMGGACLAIVSQLSKDRT